MIHYMGPKKEHEIKKTKKYLIIGISAAAIMGYTLFSCNNTQYNKTGHIKEKIYQKAAKITQQGLYYHPDIANTMIQQSIGTLTKIEDNIDSKTYSAMFQIIKEKAEQDPKILDEFGPNALKYQKGRLIREYKGCLEDAIKEGKENIRHLLE